MNQKHFEILRRDFEECRWGLDFLIIKLKLVYYFFERPIANFFLRRRLKKYAAIDEIFRNFDKFLLNEGGMYKEYVYHLCNKIHPINDATILVPGVGYGRNLSQLAKWKPKRIVAFDLYEYKEEWDYLAKKLKNEFGVDVLFLKGGTSIVPKEYFNSFDFIISDAVLEHIRNFDNFVESSRKFLKKDGIFYASFGPLWYGPGGDHIAKKDSDIYNHLILLPEEYEKYCNDLSLEIKNDLCEGTFFVREKLFSYLKVRDYFDIFEKNEFKKILAYAKISGLALSLMNNQIIVSSLDKNNVPVFDRFCSGIYLWMKLKQ